ncbi:MAG TPA: enoyl-CoA hydratase-related protein [Candidatus Margulisiibacteriota bacterium]|nr:enoyl-CoA hydratase-related protein [Candidatus Margulisiibacteriota bacterium]
MPDDGVGRIDLPDGFDISCRDGAEETFGKLQRILCVHALPLCLLPDRQSCRADASAARERTGASTTARFADTHARVGVMPGWGLSQKLSRAVGIYRAKELSLTGNYLSAEQAAEWGLVNRVVSPAELLPACRQLAKDMLSCVPDVMLAYKRVIDEGYATTLGEGLKVESRAARESARALTPEALAARRAAAREKASEGEGAVAAVS